MANETVSFCCGQGPYVVLINRELGGTTISLARAHPPFSVTLTISDVCVGCDIRRGDEPAETRILDRVPGMEDSYGKDD